MSGGWSGRKVTAARSVMAQQFLLGEVGCWLCGDVVDPATPWVVEHKRPLALGGEAYAPDNWAISHRRCSDASGSGVAKAAREGAFLPAVEGAGRRRPSFPLTPGPAPTSTDQPLPHDLLGTPTPRLFSPPLTDLSTPTGSAGHECIEWCEANLGVELLDWQKWFLIHALELKADGTFRFQTVLLLVSRQNGKTTVIECLTAWFLATQPGTLVLGTSTATELAREPWNRVADHCEALGIATSIKRGALDTSIRTSNGSRYKVAAANRRGGRSLSVDLLVLDELREMLDDWDAYNALSGTTTAKANALTLALSNAGDGRSVVLSGLRDAALDGADPALGLFEWSAPEDAAIDDPAATAQANPALGHTITVTTLNSKRSTMPEAGYRTEHLCQRVASTLPGTALVTEAVWANLHRDAPRTRPDAIALEAWFGEGVSVACAWRTGEVHVTDHPDLLAAALYARSYGVSTVLVGASLVSDPALRGLHVRPQTGRTTAAVADLSRLLAADEIRHTGEDHLTEQVLAVRTQPATDGARLISKGRADAIKAAVWALTQARKPSAGKPRIITASAASTV